MSIISQEIGKKVRTLRKNKSMTLVELACKINKSKATLSKYEKGEIVIDIVTLYEIAKALQVPVERLLYTEPSKPVEHKSSTPTFFKGLNTFYSYVYDGRSNKLMRCVFDVLAEENTDRFKVMMYMNFESYDNYQRCENTYYGYMEHFDALSNILMTNSDTNMEKVSINILASFLDSDTKWGLFCGVSSRPMMPIAVKMLFSKKILKEDDTLIQSLKVSKEDIRLLKHYNMLSAT